MSTSTISTVTKTNLSILQADHMTGTFSTKSGSYTIVARPDLGVLLIRESGNGQKSFVVHGDRASTIGGVLTVFRKYTRAYITAEITHINILTN